ncbi:RNA-binding S4 domain-containing protein [bacterium]|nr:RNA-binding S4 domain-containing protein [bacterium]MBU1984594.1 RNA-binding S4 domain-containing protein [bacterium]
MKLRIDIWLHRARLFKSRTQATAACREGKIMVNDKFADAGDLVAEGDTVKIRMRGLYRSFLVKEAAKINLSKQEAKRMYEEVTTPEALEKFRQVEASSREFRTAAKQDSGSRPTKKSRRTLEKLRRK